MGFSPWIVPLLYSSEFQEASELLKLFVLGDVLKLLTWPLTYALIALGRSSNFLFVELVSVFAYIIVIFLFVGTMGASAAGLSIVIIYTLTLPLCYFILNKRLSFRWSRFAIKLFVVTFTLVLSIYLIGIYSISWAAVCSVVFSVSASAYSIFMIRSRMNDSTTGAQ
jgi:PST family polysaccharide transporter